MDEKVVRIKELVNRLNEASKAYYQENREIMSNYEYDKLYDELVELEKETGIVLSNSPTVKVGYELLSSLPKEAHEQPMLSLDKTKDVNALVEWLGDKKGILSWKLDGLTIVLTYSNGELIKAVTRGNGEVGEVVTNNAKVFRNLPIRISYKGNLVLRGEAVIRYSDFEKINREIENVDAKYKNPRNLCSGSVRQLNNRITAERNVYFFAFQIVKVDEPEIGKFRSRQLNWLKSQGFDVVEFKEVDSSNLEQTVKWFSEQVVKNDFPADGLVLAYDDVEYGRSLGTTAKFPRDSIAFKWQDEVAETRLIKIEWSASRTGLINPIAVFEPVELEGTTVKRASVHNISVMESLELGIGDTIGVYKANMIIPQIAYNLTKSGNIEIPEHCPVCGGQTQIRQENGVKFLYCTNGECPAKHIKSLVHFVSRDAMGIDGLSEATIEKFVEKGFIKDYADIFRLERFRNEIVKMEGFGEKSYSNLISSINKARKTNAVRLLYSMGIPGIGLSNAKRIAGYFNHEWGRIENATFEELINIDGIGDIMARDFVAFFKNERNRERIRELMAEIELEKETASDKSQIFRDITFVITGSVNHFKNRAELKKVIEERGGRVTESVTSNTNYLINNDINSTSAKNKKAKELGIPIITEEQFLEWLNDGVIPGE
ncbi:DNA ligase (NAD(+)) LigA [Thermoclostridium stercorarium subsp. thermolacticum DSM 2910]|jgi:DNA ligase (NAD+)|uniref:DNA ligase n=2 Tax=Thermoclostridium stercorarium TaxID=1510 RepID=A0A1B1YID4_THEST|nr:NAD-dependent DNA ligase LigA [Thermoclostridium stercorarium]ANW97987.1 DNA ligase (NAD(+)) LigA [Thermoclostridium stercorarium subsp. thermolacticum DSM 2910]ANX00537.1 DNA ligase (NAD(+)) LigA [Thermoclostridium stercorarium subsp. leptospartum DSM 9219]UZQ86149.1 NAD-dependent DNA ligase LigA [Thermoclostridium stercorarium]